MYDPSNHPRTRPTRRIIAIRSFRDLRRGCGIVDILSPHFIRELKASFLGAGGQLSGERFAGRRPRAEEAGVGTLLEEVRRGELRLLVAEREDGGVSLRVDCP